MEVEPLTALLGKAQAGDKRAFDAVFARTYRELRGIAQRHVATLPRGAGLDPTAVVNAACEKLLAAEKMTAENRRHFFFLLERAMHDVLVEHVRSNLAAKRGAGWKQVPLTNIVADGHTTTAAATSVQEAMEELRGVDPDAAHVVSLRYFCGQSIEQTAEIMGCTFSVARRHWDYGKAWLHERLSRDGAGGGGLRQQ